MEKAFDRVELVSFNENRMIKLKDTELILSALPSGSSIGGCCWKIEYNKQVVVYAVELNDRPLYITKPMKFDELKFSHVMISNGFISPKKYKQSRVYQFISEEKLRMKMEKVLVDNGGQILLPISDKNRILQCLIMLENMF